VTAESKWGDVLVKALKWVSSYGELTLDQLNGVIPADAPLEDLDELYVLLEKKGVVLVDSHSEKRLEMPVINPESEDPLDELIADEQMELLANPARHYVGVVRKHSKLSESEERELVRGVENGEDGAREALVTAFMPLVVKIARRFKRSGVPFMELVLAGNEGLVEAISHHKADSGVSFGRTARWWVRHRLSRCVADNWQGSRLPERVARHLKRLAKVVARYRGRRYHDPSAAFLARALRLPLDEIFLLQGLYSSPLSLQAPMGGEFDGGTLADKIPDLRAREGLNEVERAQERARLDELLEKLEVPERRVLVLRFGLEDRVARSLDEVARLTGLSRIDVAACERRGLAKLRGLSPS